MGKMNFEGVCTKNDYHPFGMIMPGRSYSFETQYRFGFNGKESDAEVGGNGNQYNYGFRIYNPRLGRFLTVDPLTKEYAELTPFQFSSNSPIANIDLDGLESQLNPYGFIVDGFYQYFTAIASWCSEVKAKVKLAVSTEEDGVKTTTSTSGSVEFKPGEFMRSKGSTPVLRIITKKEIEEKVEVKVKTANVTVTNTSTVTKSEQTTTAMGSTQTTTSTENNVVMSNTTSIKVEGRISGLPVSNTTSMETSTEGDQTSNTTKVGTENLNVGVTLTNKDNTTTAKTFLEGQVTAPVPVPSGPNLNVTLSGSISVTFQPPPTKP